MNYQQFVKSKKHLSGNFGFEPIYQPDILFNYQDYIVNHAVNKGRCAIFADTGLGKTLIELSIAINIIKKTNKKVILLTPLAVAFQFIKECDLLKWDDVEYCKDGKHTKKLIITNYERLHYFNAKDFECIILDESSILKNFDGSTKTQLNSFAKNIKYRFAATATPSPNDFIELGTTSEFLGYLGYMDMISKFFSNKENNLKAQDRIGAKFYLKPHAEKHFFEWVSGWSISIRKPSDLGFNDDKHVLPKLIINYHPVKNDENWVINGQIMLFNHVAQRLTEVRQEQKMTEDKRCQKAIELASKHDTSVYWCNFNNEGDLLEQMDSQAKQIKGSMSIDKKEELLLAFANGEIKKLITKPKMTGFGLNWQHCNHTVYFPTFSYEQYYQAIRRFWRFGQKNNVEVDLVYSDGQKRVIDSLEVKANKAVELFDKLNTTLNSMKFDDRVLEDKINLPTWI